MDAICESNVGQMCERCKVPRHFEKKIMIWSGQVFFCELQDKLAKFTSHEPPSLTRICFTLFLLMLKAIQMREVRKFNLQNYNNSNLIKMLNAADKTDYSCCQLLTFKLNSILKTLKTQKAVRTGKLHWSLNLQSRSMIRKSDQFIKLGLLKSICRIFVS